MILLWNISSDFFRGIENHDCMRSFDPNDLKIVMSFGHGFIDIDKGLRFHLSMDSLGLIWAMSGVIFEFDLLIVNQDA